MIPEPDCVNPPFVAGERTMLRSWLDFQRDALASKCAGLTAEQMRERAVPPSNLSLLGLLRHMTEVERGWFGRGLAGEDIQPQYYSEERPDDDFDDIADQDPDDAYAIFRDACERSRQLESAAESLDVTMTRTRDEKEFTISLRWIMVRMIEEYARHNGHADFLRERIDGKTGD